MRREVVDEGMVMVLILSDSNHEAQISEDIA